MRLLGGVTPTTRAQGQAAARVSQPFERVLFHGRRRRRSDRSRQPVYRQWCGQPPDRRFHRAVYQGSFGRESERAGQLPVEGCAEDRRIARRVSQEPLFLDRTAVWKQSGREELSFVCVPVQVGAKAAGSLGVALPYETQINFWREPIKSWVGSDMAVVVVNAEQLAEGRDLPSAAGLLSLAATCRRRPLPSCLDLFSWPRLFKCL